LGNDLSGLSLRKWFRREPGRTKVRVRKRWRAFLKSEVNTAHPPVNVHNSLIERNDVQKGHFEGAGRQVKKREKNVNRDRNPGKEIS